MKRFNIIIAALLISFLFSPITSSYAQNEPSVVHAVLFYSPTCGHCHFVMQETLPTLMEHYGDQLQIIAIDVTQPSGQTLFASARERFGLETTGVPFLVVGNEYLVGSSDIPDKFPVLIEQYLAKGGVDWPDIPRLRDAIYAAQTAQAPTPTSVPITAAVTREPAPQTAETFPLSGESESNVWERVMRDPPGNGLAIIVLLIMIIVVTKAALSFRNGPQASFPDNTQVLIPILCVIGFVVAGYLTYVETTQTTAVCGPVGDCNTVQQSEYAKLFGILPIGLLGIIGYLLILFSWLLGKTQKEPIATLGKLTTFGLSIFGITFSIYLTFLEPFIIGATCAWCIASAIVMCLLFILALPEGRNSLSKLARIPLFARNP